MTWTPERLATLTTMWNEGASASRIAKTLGGVTRNAVIGKIHRLGLHAHHTPTPAVLDNVAQEQAQAMRRELAQARTLEDLRSILDGWLKTGALRPHAHPHPRPRFPEPF